MNIGIRTSVGPKNPAHFCRSPLEINPTCGRMCLSFYILVIFLGGFRYGRGKSEVVQQQQRVWFYRD